MISTETGQNRVWRIAGWLLLATAAFFFSIPSIRLLDQHLHWRISWQVLRVALAAANLLLAWAIGLLRRHAPLGFVLFCAALPALHYFFMLFYGCALWNTLAGHYECGL